MKITEKQRTAAARRLLKINTKSKHNDYNNQVLKSDIIHNGYLLINSSCLCWYTDKIEGINEAEYIDDNTIFIYEGARKAYYISKSYIDTIINKQYNNTYGISLNELKEYIKTAKNKGHSKIIPIKINNSYYNAELLRDLMIVAGLDCSAFIEYQQSRMTRDLNYLKISDIESGLLLLPLRASETIINICNDIESEV